MPSDSRTEDQDGSPALLSALRRAGGVVVLGLLIEAATLFSSHPTAFLFFALCGLGLVVLGIAGYLWAVLRAEPAVAEPLGPA